MVSAWKMVCEDGIKSDDARADLGSGRWSGRTSQGIQTEVSRLQVEVATELEVAVEWRFACSPETAELTA